jgi:hypothetical protein
MRKQIEQSVTIAYLEGAVGAIGADGALYGWREIDEGTIKRDEPIAQTIWWDLGRSVIRTFDGKTYDVEVDVKATVTELELSEGREWDGLFAPRRFDSTTTKKHER